MTIKNIIKNLVLLFLATLITFSVAVSSETPNRRAKINSDKFVNAITFIASKPYDSVDGTFFVNGLVEGDGLDFFKSVMGYSDQKIAKNRKKAIEFYQKRFGLDVNDSRLYFTGYQVNAASDYRALMISTEDDDSNKKYPVLDGGWGLFVMDPAGIDLGGEFAGTHVSVGSMFAHGGSYVIKLGQGRDDIVINYQARGPLQPMGIGSVFDLDIYHSELGAGISWGYSELHSLSNDRITAQARSVLTFPGFDYQEQLFQN